MEGRGTDVYVEAAALEPDRSFPDRAKAVNKFIYEKRPV